MNSVGAAYIQVRLIVRKLRYLFLVGSVLSKEEQECVCVCVCILCVVVCVCVYVFGCKC
jgi:hypothetical protein